MIHPGPVAHLDKSRRHLSSPTGVGSEQEWEALVKLLVATNCANLAF